ncbi:hypothetical protein [Terrisporobacter petrolearius]
MKRYVTFLKHYVTLCNKNETLEIEIEIEIDIELDTDIDQDFS